MDPNNDGNPEDGIDGWRLDVAAEVPINFWKEFRKWVKEINPDSYITGDLYQVGCFVENVNTGIIGKVVSRGSNYVIYVDEQDNIFRSWLKDLIEKSILDFGFDYTPAGEVGTKQLNDYMRKLTPGEFIRKINKKDKVTK